MESATENQLMYTAYTFFIIGRRNKVNAKFLIKQLNLPVWMFEKFCRKYAFWHESNLYSYAETIIGSDMLYHLATGKCLVSKMQITVK